MTFEFSRDRKSMSVLLERTTDASAGIKGAQSTRSTKTSGISDIDSTVLFVKGAPETILERCSFIRSSSNPEKSEPMTEKSRKAILKRVAEWADHEALRVLAMAIVDKPSIREGDKVKPEDYAKIESNMTFIGLVGMMDPPRPQVRESIVKCRAAGIRVIVITGDNKNTAESICRQIGVFGDDEDVEGKSFTGREFAEMSLEQKRKAVMAASLFSRTEPSHKQELVEILKSQDEIVAMVRLPASIIGTRTYFFT